MVKARLAMLLHNEEFRVDGPCWWTVVITLLAFDEAKKATHLLPSHSNHGKDLEINSEPGEASGQCLCLLSDEMEHILPSKKTT